MLTILGEVRKSCDGFSRREIIQAGGAGLFGLSLPNLMAAESHSLVQRPKAKSVIFLPLFGGPSQLETFDQAYAALIRDLDERGLLAETLVVATGEMGRTPKANAKWGRDHWSTLFPAVLAGGGVDGGCVYGKSDKEAAYPIDNPVSPEDLSATIYHALGINHDLRVINSENRPTAIVDGGTPVTALF